MAGFLNPVTSFLILSFSKLFELSVNLDWHFNVQQTLILGFIAMVYTAVTYTINGVRTTAFLFV